MVILIEKLSLYLKIILWSIPKQFVGNAVIFRVEKMKNVRNVVINFKITFHH